MGCLLGANLGPTWRPRRLQDEPEVEKKGSKKDEKSRFMLGTAQSSKMRPKMTLQTRFLEGFGIDFGRCSRPSCKDF